MATREKQVRKAAAPARGRSPQHKTDTRLRDRLSQLSSFTEVLQTIMDERQWTDSDMARFLWGDEQNHPRNWRAARGRDKIGAWRRGQSTPNGDSLEFMSDKLDIPVEVLAPDLLQRDSSRTASRRYHLYPLKNHPQLLKFEVNIVVPIAQMAQLVELMGRIDEIVLGAENDDPNPKLAPVPVRSDAD